MIRIPPTSIVLGREDVEEFENRRRAERAILEQQALPELNPTSEDNEAGQHLSTSLKASPLLEGYVPSSKSAYSYSNSLNGSFGDLNPTFLHHTDYDEDASSSEPLLESSPPTLRPIIDNYNMTAGMSRMTLNEEVSDPSSEIEYFDPAERVAPMGQTPPRGLDGGGHRVRSESDGAGPSRQQAEAMNQDHAALTRDAEGVSSGEPSSVEQLSATMDRLFDIADAHGLRPLTLPKIPPPPFLTRQSAREDREQGTSAEDSQAQVPHWPFSRRGCPRETRETQDSTHAQASQDIETSEAIPATPRRRMRVYEDLHPHSAPRTPLRRTRLFNSSFTAPVEAVRAAGRRARSAVRRAGESGHGYWRSSEGGHMHWRSGEGSHVQGRSRESTDSAGATGAARSEDSTEARGAGSETTERTSRTSEAEDAESVFTARPTTHRMTTFQRGMSELARLHEEEEGDSDY